MKPALVEKFSSLPYMDSTHAMPRPSVCVGEMGRGEGGGGRGEGGGGRGEGGTGEGG